MGKSTDFRNSYTFTEIFSDLPIAKETTSSRVVLNNQLLRVVMFAFDKGELLTEHATPRAVVCQLLRGRMNFTVDGQEREITAGDVVYLAPGAPHALVALEPCYLSLVMVDTKADLSTDSSTTPTE